MENELLINSIVLRCTFSVPAVISEIWNQRDACIFLEKIQLYLPFGTSCQKNYYICTAFHSIRYGKEEDSIFLQFMWLRGAQMVW
jgi:hypothetical protein